MGEHSNLSRLIKTSYISISALRGWNVLPSSKLILLISFFLFESDFLASSQFTFQPLKADKDELHLHSMTTYAALHEMPLPDHRMYLSPTS
jgi:hypothetical protein